MITQEQVQNTVAVAKFIRSLCVGQIDMEHFVSAGPVDKKPNLCDSVCCVLGWTPFVVDCERFLKAHGYDYDDIQQEILGVTSSSRIGIELFNPGLPNDPLNLFGRLMHWANSKGDRLEFLRCLGIQETFE